MKKSILIAVFFSIFTFGNAQDTASVEKSIFGIQTGFLGVWVHNEARLANNFVLRSEIGLDAGIFITDRSNFAGIGAVPVITASPRWYYNLQKRKDRNKNIAGNAASFVALKVSYHPDLFVLHNDAFDGREFVSDLSIIPTWGIRRNLGSNFNYELGLGVGYIRYFPDEDVFFTRQDEVAVNLHIRIGYRF